MCNETQFGRFIEVGGGYSDRLVLFGSGAAWSSGRVCEFPKNSLATDKFRDFLEIFLKIFFDPEIFVLHSSNRQRPITRSRGCLEVVHRASSSHVSPCRGNKAQCLQGFPRIRWWGATQRHRPNSVIPVVVHRNRSGEKSRHGSIHRTRSKTGENDGDACNLSRDQFRWCTSVIRFRES